MKRMDCRVKPGNDELTQAALASLARAEASALILFSTICRMRVGGASMASLIGRRMRGCFSLRWIA